LFYRTFQRLCFNGSAPESCTGTRSADLPVPAPVHRTVPSDQGAGTGRVVSPRVRVQICLSLPEVSPDRAITRTGFFTVYLTTLQNRVVVKLEGTHNLHSHGTDLTNSNSNSEKIRGYPAGRDRSVRVRVQVLEYPHASRLLDRFGYKHKHSTLTTKITGIPGQIENRVISAYSFTKIYHFSQSKVVVQSNR
jgi:hypothetical protein